jgi:transposase-like protein
MPQHRTRHSAEFKAKTLAELATEYRVHPTQLTRWKQRV